MYEQIDQHLDNAVAIEHVDGRWIACELWDQLLTRNLPLTLQHRLVNQFIFMNEAEIELFLDDEDPCLLPLRELVSMARAYGTSMVMTLDELLSALEQRGEVSMDERPRWGASLQTLEVAYDGRQCDFDALSLHLLPPKVNLKQPLSDIDKFRVKKWLRAAGAMIDIKNRVPQTVHPLICENITSENPWISVDDAHRLSARTSMLLASNDSDRAKFIGEGWFFNEQELAGESFSAYAVELPSTPQRIGSTAKVRSMTDRLPPVDILAAA